MKFFAVFLAIFALIISTQALKDEICGQPPEADGTGPIRCAAYIPAWTYDAKTNECRKFVYGGCGGNDNRFGSKDACEEKCKE